MIFFFFYSNSFLVTENNFGKITMSLVDEKSTWLLILNTKVKKSLMNELGAWRLGYIGGIILK